MPTEKGKGAGETVSGGRLGAHVTYAKFGLLHTQLEVLRNERKVEKSGPRS